MWGKPAGKSSRAYDSADLAAMMTFDPSLGYDKLVMAIEGGKMALSRLEIGGVIAVLGLTFTAGGFFYSLEDRIGRVEERSTTGQDIDRLESMINEVGASAPEVGAIALTGAVIASTVRCPQLGPDWFPYDKGAGRVLVGVGRGNGRSVRNFEDTGGEEEHILTVDQIPNHEHPVVDPGHSHKLPGEFITNRQGVNEWGGTEPGGSIAEDQDLDISRDANSDVEVGPIGGGGAHNNMPPYIALHFCIKE